MAAKSNKIEPCLLTVRLHHRVGKVKMLFSLITHCQLDRCHTRFTRSARSHVPQIELRNSRLCATRSRLGLANDKQLKAGVYVC